MSGFNPHYGILKSPGDLAARHDHYLYDEINRVFGFDRHFALAGFELWPSSHASGHFL